MYIARCFGVILSLLLLSQIAFPQQLKLGKFPYDVEKSAVLELKSDNQGLLLPRIADTALINTLSPPDGMAIFFIPTSQLLLRANGHWEALGIASSLNNYWSVNGNSNGALKQFGNIDDYSLPFITNNTERMLIDNLGNIGIGTSSFDATNPEKLLIDAGVTSSYNLFAAKGTINNYLQLNIQNRSNGNSASSDIVATADNGTESLNYIDMGINSSGYANVALPVLNGVNNAYLYSTGNDFIIGNGIASKNLRFFTGGYATANERLRIDGNGRVGVGVTSPTAILHLKAGTASANTAPLKFTSGTLLTTAAAGAVEFLTDKFYGTIATGAARKEFTLNDAPLVLGRIPVITTNGRLTSNANLVWNNTTSSMGVLQATPTAYLHLGAGTATASTAPLKFTSGINLTAPENGSVEFDGTHFYGTVGSTRYQFDQQVGTTYTGSNGITLSGNDFRNDLITGIAGGQTITGGTAAGNSLTLSSTNHATKGNIVFGTSVYDEVNNRLGIANSTPSEALDVTGNFRFSGALMPSNAAGTTGYLLQSNGVGASPTWINPSLSSSVWSLTGNGAIDPATNFMGTTDNKSLRFRTNNTERFIIDSIGNIGIGITSPGNYLEVAGTNTTTGVSGLRLNNLGTATTAAANLKVLTVNSTGDVIVTDNPAATQWSYTGNSGIDPNLHFLGTTDDQQMILKSNNQSFVEFGRRQKLGLTQAYPEYDDNDEKVTYIRSALQFEAANAQFYKPKMFTDVNGNFRVKGSSAGTDFFEFGSTGSANNGGFEFIIGDDGDEPILFKSYHYINGMSEIMRLQSGRMAVGSNSFNATNPEKLLIDAGVTDSYNLMTGKGSIDNYLQINVQNSSAGGSASSDIVATSNNGSESANYIDMGINSDGYTNTSFPVLGGANTAYLYSTGNDLVMGNGTANKNMRFFTGGFASANERMRIDGNGNLAIGATTFDATDPEKLLIDAGTTTSFNLINARGNINNYLQFNIQNESSGLAASTDIVATNNTGTETARFIDMGINSSGYSNSGILGGANNAYLYSTGSDLIIGNATPGEPFRFFTGGTATTNERMRIDGSGNVGIGTTNPSHALDVEESNNTVASFNRTGFSDGTIISIQKSGTEIGTISNSGGTVSYNAFTGSHYGWTSQDIQMGMLVTLTGSNQYLHDNKNSEIIYGIRKSAQPNDPKIMGAYLGLQESSKPYDASNPNLVMAVGNGVMWVVDKGENIEIGDYLISSEVSGHAMKDNGFYPTTYVIARVAEPVNWTTQTETINGVKHKLVSVFFESFVRNNAQKELEDIKKEMKEMRERIKQLENKNTSGKE